MGVDFYANVGYGLAFDSGRMPWDGSEYGGDWEFWMRRQYADGERQPPVEVVQLWNVDLVLLAGTHAAVRDEGVKEFDPVVLCRSTVAAPLIEFCERHGIDTRRQQPRWLLFGRVSA